MMDDDLLDLYRNLCSKAMHLPSPLVERLGCPFFPFPRGHWREAKKRIIVVGQEPYEWGFEAGWHYPWEHPRLWTLGEAREYPKSVEALTSAYRMHIYEIPSPFKIAPFQKAFKVLMAAADRERNGDVLSTNLFRCVLRIDGHPTSRSALRGTREELRQILDWQRGCLTNEIRILRPTAVVFFTGPYYDEVLKDEFQGAELAAVNDRPVRQFARVIHNSLPRNSFRTYHPSYLHRGKWSWIEELAVRVTEDQQ